VVHASGAPPLALRVELDGKTLAYSGDTEWTDALADVSRDADVFICEAHTFAKRVRYQHAGRHAGTRLATEVTAAHDGLEPVL
jgi:ribonuclease BN (tRNA processing enzyme)